ncbi:MAG: enolase C-terminal domain-like protein [Pirellulales bacterium]
MPHSASTTQLQHATATFRDWQLVQPLTLSTGTIADVTEAQIRVTVRVGEREATGRGSIYLSDLWAWPDPQFSHEERVRRLRSLCHDLATHATSVCGGEPAHPLELGLRLHAFALAGHGSESARGIPPLARLLCASPLDAAIHDAVGRACRCSSLALYDTLAPIPSLDDRCPPEGACAAVHRLLRETPCREFPATLVVDPRSDLQPLCAEWLGRRGYRRVKLKLTGQSPADDAARVSEVVGVMRAHGVTHPWLSVDSNEAHPSADSVLEFLARLARDDADAYEALQYLEQPTARDLHRAPQDWRAVAARKPVLLDEGWVSLDDLVTARQQGWSGLALKTCKGHSLVLAAAILARAQGLQLTLQDLTNPGRAALHAAVLGAYLPTLNGLELNSPQFTPQANAAWLPRWQPLLDPRDGWHRFPPGPLPTGLGGE